MTPWRPPVFARMPHGSERTCIDANCLQGQHPATYQVERTSTLTGEVARTFICTIAAARLAWKHKVTFPPAVMVPHTRGS